MNSIRKFQQSYLNNYNELETHVSGNPITMDLSIIIVIIAYRWTYIGVDYIFMKS